MTKNSSIKTEYSCIVLAGGKGSRIAADKAQLLWEGKPFLQHIIDKAKGMGMDNILVSGHDCQEDNVISVIDEIKERGPLGGIHACLKASESPYCIVLPIDVPNIPVSVLDQLIKYHQVMVQNWASDVNVPVLIWEHGDRKEPLIGIYPKTMAGEIEQLIQFKSAPVFRILDKWGYTSRRIELNGEEIINVNTKDDYKKLIEIG